MAVPGGRVAGELLSSGRGVLVLDNARSLETVSGKGCVTLQTYLMPLSHTCKMVTTVLHPLLHNKTIKLKELSLTERK